MHKINKVAPDTQNFLQIISTIDNSIKSLYFIGNLPQQRATSVAIVGTRKPSSYGREIGYQLTYELARRGVIIISGLALGMDGIAHRAALDAGGTTIAILPTSIQDIHPTSHRKLAAEIIEKGGALISEYSPEQTIFKSNFLARNRIVSALSDGVLIVEAAARSGTLATAGFALNQGKPVMAVPGNITSPMSAGCNKLISKGARLIASTEDILEEIGFASNVKQASLPLAYSIEEKAIINLLISGVRDGEILQKQSGLQAAIFNQTLTMLEIDGKVRALGANQWTIT